MLESLLFCLFIGATPILAVGLVVLVIYIVDPTEKLRRERKKELNKPKPATPSLEWCQAMRELDALDVTLPPVQLPCCICERESVDGFIDAFQQTTTWCEYHGEEGKALALAQEEAETCARQKRRELSYRLDRQLKAERLAYRYKTKYYYNNIYYNKKATYR